MYSGITEQDYQTLSEIARTVTQTDEYIEYGVPWQVSTKTIGKALGREQQANEIVADIEGQFEDARAAHPEWESSQLVVVAGSPQGEEGGLGFFASQDPRARFFGLLGFTPPPQLDEIAGEQFYGTLSRERLDLVDTDVLVWDQLAIVDGGQATVLADPLVQQLSVIQGGRTVFLEGEVENAFGGQSPLSIPFALEQIVPMLAAATDGNAAT